MRIFFNFGKFMHCTAEDLFWQNIFVSAYSDLQCCPSVLHTNRRPVLLAIPENPPCWLLLTKTLHQLDVSLLLTFCVQNVDIFGKIATSLIRILLFNIKLSLFFICSGLLHQYLILISLKYCFCFACFVVCFFVFVCFLCFVYCIFSIFVYVLAVSVVGQLALDSTNN